MAVPLPEPPLLVITDRRHAARGLLETACAAFDGGCRWISLREPDLRRADRLARLYNLIAVAAPYGATVMVHGDIDSASGAGAHGVHLPRGGDPAAARRALGSAALIGVSAHSLEEARDAEQAGADYVTLSPIFSSDSKPGYGPAVGVDGLAYVVANVSIPLVALGGITENNIADCFQAGATGAAVMGAVMRAPDPGAAVFALLKAMARRDDKPLSPDPASP